MVNDSGINASNAFWRLRLPGYSAPPPEQTLRARYPGLAQLSYEELGNYDNYMRLFGNSSNPQMNFWSAVQAQDPALANRVMNADLAAGPNGQLQRIETDQQHRNRETGAIEDRNVFARHPWLGPALG